MIKVANLKIIFFKRILKNNNIEMYSTYNEGESVVSERFIRNLKNKIYKHLTALLGDVCFDVLDDIAKTNTPAVHRTIQVKPI